MRVLQLVLGEQIWGIERYIITLCKGLIEHGDAVFAACASDGPIRRELETLGVEIASVPMVSYIDMASLNSLKALVERWKPDVIHAHMGRDSFIGAMVAEATKVPIVSSVHFVEPAYMQLAFPLRQLWRLLQAGKNRMISQFLPVSEVVAERLVKREFVNRDKITVVYPGIRTIDRVSASEKDEARAALGLVQSQIVVATIARLTQEKGLDTLVEAIPQVVRQVPNAIFVIAGDGPERQSLEHLAQSNNSNHAVRFLGYMSNARPLIAAADLLVVPSREEAFGYAPLEALCAGIPVVGTDAPGLSEVLAAADAVRVPRNDPAKLSAAIVQEAISPSQLDEELSIRLQQSFSVAAMVDRVRDVYTKVGAPNGSCCV